MHGMLRPHVFGRTPEVLTDAVRHQNEWLTIVNFVKNQNAASSTSSSVGRVQGSLKLVVVGSSPNVANSAFLFSPIVLGHDAVVE
ncbi:hypothetical protein L484_014284 [Morus notabilis]|uniref:Uncharacterized protein n=1 Tax=Morus notabilis TaxID=981085 RepID=W9RK10_9ROSA|nr:hypothetical protein L484_014284 [Morus notabilis]